MHNSYIWLLHFVTDPCFALGFVLLLLTELPSLLGHLILTIALVVRFLLLVVYPPISRHLVEPQSLKELYVWGGVEYLVHDEVVHTRVEAYEWALFQVFADVALVHLFACFVCDVFCHSVGIAPDGMVAGHTLAESEL